MTGNVVTGHIAQFLRDVYFSASLPENHATIFILVFIFEMLLPNTIHDHKLDIC